MAAADRCVCAAVRDVPEAAAHRGDAGGAWLPFPPLIEASLAFACFLWPPLTDVASPEALLSAPPLTDALVAGDVLVAAGDRRARTLRLC